MSEFRRPSPESYGPSTINLKKLDMKKGFEHIKAGGVDIILPVLNAKKYDPDVECYALIERLDNMPITMVDVLYSYKDILDRFEKDENFRKEFFKYFNRKQINIASLTSPILTMSPRRTAAGRSFAEAVKQAVQDAVGSQILWSTYRSEETMDVEVPKDPEKIKEDSIMVDFIKSFYEIVSGVKVKRPSDPYIEKVKYIMNKAAILMKSGSMIIGEEEVAKIFANFRTELSMEELQDARDSTSVYISGIDAKRMMDSPEDFVQFGDTLLESNALEAFSSLNPEKLPKLAYVGEYNKEEKRIKVNRRIDRYYDRLNETLVPTKPSDDGR